MSDNDAEDLRQMQAENARLQLRVNQIDRKFAELAAFEAEFFPEPPKIEEVDEGSNQDLHEQVDLFTHSGDKCPNRKRMSKFERSLNVNQDCTACFDPSTMMDSEDWQPANHRATLRKFPALAKKEKRDQDLIQMSRLSKNGNHSEAHQIPDDDESFYMSDASDVVDEASQSNLPRSTLAFRRRTHREIIVIDSSSDEDIGRSKKRDGKDHVKHHNTGRTKNAYNVEDDMDENDDSESGDLDEEAYDSDWPGEENGYDGSSSPVKS